MKRQKRDAEARARKIREETARMEREEIVRRERRRTKQQAKRMDEQKIGYEQVWEQLIKGKRKSDEKDRNLRFEDLPWPIFFRKEKGDKTPFDLEEITPDRIEAFLLSQPSNSSSSPEIGPSPSYFVFPETSQSSSRPRVG